MPTDWGYICKAMTLGPLILRLCACLVALAIALSGLGMERAHAQTAPADVHMAHAMHVDRSAHASSGHMLHEMADAEHDGHTAQSECGMTACCHLGATVIANPDLATSATGLAFTASRDHQHSKADRDRADKPPKHA